MDDLTKQALQAAKTKTKPVNPDPKVDGGIVPESEIQKGELSPKSETKKDNEVILGPNKKVTITPWTGKTRKKFRKIFENVQSPEDINFKAVIQILLYDHINEDVFLNEGEQQLLLSEIKKISLSDTIKDTINCYVCDIPIEVKEKLDDVVEYKENRLPHQFKDITFRDVSNQKEIDDILENMYENKKYDGISEEPDIIFASHIEMKDKDIFDIINYLDDLPLKDLTEIVTNLKEYMPECKIESEVSCTCGNKDIYPLDITKEIFESLMT
jgi:succinate dehydrogenase flavin-adding protein (antitoxin of CptAB toxin-antitoxin module)